VRVLSIVHHDLTDGGVFDEIAVELGHAVERWLPPEHGTAARRPTDYDAIMVFGGAMHPDQEEEHPWLGHELGFLRQTLDAGVPVLGVCLGAQLLARAAGATVGPADTSEVGWVEVELTAAGRADPVLSTLPARVDAFQWHHYTFGLPHAATELATSAAARQAFSLGGHAWGIQFHAEVTREMVASWAVDGAEQLSGTPEELIAQTGDLIEGWNAAGRRLCSAFLENARD
jgi:GMP synthase (glutamine-hydrolysing)